MEMEEINIVSNAINMSYMLNRPRLILHRSLHIFEEEEAYNMLINQPDNTIILYDERNNHRYYFGKINGQIYHVITNSNMTTIYCVRLLDY